MAEYRFNIFADYFQVYLQDDTGYGLPEGGWSQQQVDALVADLIAVAPGVLCFCPVRNMTVPVTVELREDPPSEDLRSWDHVTMASIDVSSGRLVVMGCTDYFPEAARIPLRPGTYRACVFYGGLDTLSEDGLDGDDHYRVVLWPGTRQEPLVLKRYERQ